MAPMDASTTRRWRIEKIIEKKHLPTVQIGTTSI